MITTEGMGIGIGNLQPFCQRKKKRKRALLRPPLFFVNLFLGARGKITLSENIFEPYYAGNFLFNTFENLLTNLL